MLDETRYLVELSQVFNQQIIQGAVDEITNLVTIGFLCLGVGNSSFTHCERHRVLVGVREGFPRTKLELRRFGERNRFGALLDARAIESGRIKRVFFV